MRSILRLFFPVALLLTPIVSVAAEKSGGVLQTPDSIEDLQKAAEAGDARAQYVLGNRYETGVGVASDYQEALKWYELSAKNNFILAINKMADHYYSVMDNTAEAMKWYEKAASLGDVDAQWFLGELYMDQSSPEAAAKWYKKAAEAGSTVAEASLAELYMLGLGVQKDVNKAEALYRSAAEKGHRGAQEALKELAAQNNTQETITVSGEVYCPKGFRGRNRRILVPCVGVTVAYKNTTPPSGSDRSAYTDPNGRFELKGVPKGTVLVISVLGMKTVEQVASEEMRVELELDD